MAKISKGRTIKQYLFGSIIVASLYSFVYPTIYGGVGIRLERASSEIGLCCKEESGWFINPNELREILTEKNLLDFTVSSEDINRSWMCNGECSKCAVATITSKAKQNMTFMDMVNEYEYLGEDFGSATMDRTLSRPSCHSLVQMLFDVTRSVPGIGTFLSSFTLCAITIYFITSSDSASLVIDSLAANGDFDTSPFLRAFWALIEGATATALIVAGGESSLASAQAMGIISAFPVSILICLVCVASWKALKVTNREINQGKAEFEFGLFEPLAATPYRK